MTPENDKTMWGIFRPVTLGLDELNIRRDYRLKHEKEFFLGGKTKRPDHIRDILNAIIKIDNNTIIHDSHMEKSKEEDQYYQNLTKMFPESKVAIDYHKMMTFGYGRIDGEEIYCDMCGTYLHPLNSGIYYSLCEGCDELNDRPNDIAELVR